MIGQYNREEMLLMPGITSSLRVMYMGIIVRKIGSTINYYRKESDGSWTNYDCKTEHGESGSQPSILRRYI